MRILGVLLIACVTAGCAVAPGIRMSDVEVTTIDSALIARQHQAAVVEHAATAATQVAPGYTYQVGPGDVLNVVVWGHPELSNPMGQTENIEQQARLVREDGTMFFPFVGVMPVAGRTVEEIREALARDLRPFVTEPQVDVRVVAFRSKKVYVTGEVVDPGTIALTDEPLTALDAISRAGGFTADADRRNAIITRGGTTLRIDTRALYASGAGDRLLEHGDVLFVPDNEYNRVFVMGEVANQTTVPLHHGRLSLAAAISGAEGLSLNTADTRNIFVLRAERLSDGGIRPKVFHLDASSAVALILAEGFELQPRDIIYVASTGVVRFNRVMQQILPTVQTLWQADRVLND